MTAAATGPASRNTLARWAGWLYLSFILASVVADQVGHIGLSTTQSLRETITGNEAAFRLGLVAALASAILFLLTAWALYALLRPVNGPAALLLLVLNAVGVAVQCASYLPLLAALAQGDGRPGTGRVAGERVDPGRPSRTRRSRCTLRAPLHTRR
jgi:hypothetical protein